MVLSTGCYKDKVGLYIKFYGAQHMNLIVCTNRIFLAGKFEKKNIYVFFSSPGTNVLGEVLSYPRRRRRCRRCRRQFQVKVLFINLSQVKVSVY